VKPLVTVRQALICGKSTCIWSNRH